MLAVESAKFWVYDEHIGQTLLWHGLANWQHLANC